VPDATVAEPTDLVMRVDAVTICGTDLHILKGDVPEVVPGTILGHEAVGTVVETGSSVTTLHEGDRILASCITSCGRCPACREGRYGLCTGGGGWIPATSSTVCRRSTRAFPSPTPRHIGFQQP
jgi:alcohol dehydrogenase